MRVDGEPWKQPLPVDDNTVVVEISTHGQVNMLATDGCRSRSFRDPASVHYAETEDEENEDNLADEGDEWSKFGAANAFKIPDGIDISHLS